jgi:WD40 repeat protein
MWNTTATHERGDEEIRTAKSEGLPFSSAALSPDGSIIATGGDWVVQLWDIASGRLLAHFRSSYETPEIHFTPSGSEVMIVDTDDGGKKFHVHLFRPADLISNACALLPFDFVEDVWRGYILGEPYRKVCTRVQQ